MLVKWLERNNYVATILEKEDYNQKSRALIVKYGYGRMATIEGLRGWRQDKMVKCQNMLDKLEQRQESLRRQNRCANESCTCADETWQEARDAIRKEHPQMMAHQLENLSPVEIVSIFL